MRKLTLFMQISLDGFAVGPDNDMSWMHPNDNGQWNVVFSLLKNTDLIVLGRGMWSGYRDYWTKALAEPGYPRNEVKYAKLAKETSHLLFSRSLKKSGWENMTIVNIPAEKEIARLKKHEGKDIIIMGGPRFAGSLIDSGLVDECRLFINPAIIGKGKSFVRKITRKFALELTEVKKLRTGVVMVNYQQVSVEKVSPAKRKRQKIQK